MKDTVPTPPWTLVYRWVSDDYCMVTYTERMPVEGGWLYREEAWGEEKLISSSIAFVPKGKE